MAAPRDTRCTGLGREKAKSSDFRSGDMSSLLGSVTPPLCDLGQGTSLGLGSLECQIRGPEQRIFGVSFWLSICVTFRVWNLFPEQTS